MRSVRRVARLARERSRSPDYKGLLRQLVEMTALLLIRGIGPGYYHLAEMGRVGRGWRYLSSFANSREYRKAVLRVNDPLYLKISQNKSVEKAVLSAYAMPTAQFIGHLEPRRGFDTHGQPFRSASDVRAVFDHRVGSAFCLKHVEGFGGQGFLALTVQKAETGVSFLDMKEGRTLMPEDLAAMASRSGGLVIEDYLEQRQDLKEFHPSSVNTIRALVLRMADGEVRNVGTTFRIGRDGSVVDNATAGGIMADVNVRSGVMRAGVFMDPSSHSFDYHPNSGAQLEGAVLPCFEEMQALARTALDVFPKLNFAGVDIACAADGPVIIEINPQPDYVFMAINQVASRRLFDNAMQVDERSDSA